MSHEPITKVIAKMTAVLPNEYAAALSDKERRIRWFEALYDVVAFTFPDLTPNDHDVPPEQRFGLHLMKSDKPYDISVVTHSPGKYLCVLCTMMQLSKFGPTDFRVSMHPIADVETEAWKIYHQAEARKSDYTLSTHLMSHVDQKTVLQYIIDIWNSVHPGVRGGFALALSIFKLNPPLEKYVTYDHTPFGVLGALNGLISELNANHPDSNHIVPFTQETIREWRDGLRSDHGFSTEALSQLLARYKDSFDATTRDYLTYTFLPVELMLFCLYLESVHPGLGVSLRHLCQYDFMDTWADIITTKEDEKN